MPARCNCLRNGATSVIHQTLRRKYLLRGHNIVVPRSEQEYWTVQPGEIDLPAKRNELSGGQAIFLEYLFNHLQVIAARASPPSTLYQSRSDSLQPPKRRRPDRTEHLQQTMDFIALHIQRPKLQQAIAEDTPMPELDKLLENRGRSAVGEIGQLRLACRNIDWSASKYQLPDLGGKRARTEAPSIRLGIVQSGTDRAAEFVDHNIESGKIVINGPETHLRCS